VKLVALISSKFLNEAKKLSKVKALDIQVGDRIIAYCNNRMQTCTVRFILEPGQSNITLSVMTAEKYRSSSSRVVRFQKEALVDLVG
ncbi:MAG: hypothetical protein WCA35_31935, partial [Kovacikia sp.]